MVDIEELNNRFDNALRTDPPIKPFRLLDLPPELWLRIIELVVVDDEPIEITRASDSLRQAALVQQPPLTRTCRLLRREALTMYYQKNIFQAKHLCGVACPRRWFAAVGADNLRLMRQFLFHATFQPDFWAAKFADMGLKVDIRTIRDPKLATPAGFRRLDTLVIKFL